MKRFFVIQAIVATALLVQLATAGNIEMPTTRDVATRIKEAEALYASGKPADAAAVLRKIVVEKPFTWPVVPESHPEWAAYRPLGDVLASSGESVESDLYRGIGAAVEGDMAASARYFSAGSGLDPRNALLHYAAGWSILRSSVQPYRIPAETEPLRQAIKSFAAALELEPENRKALAAAGYTCVRLAFATNFKGGYRFPATVEAMGHLAQGARYLERLDAMGGAGCDVDLQLADIYKQLGNPDGYVEHRTAARKKGCSSVKSQVGGFTYYDGSNLITRSMEEIAKTEREAVGGGHMPWREEPAMVAALLLRMKTGEDWSKAGDRGTMTYNVTKRKAGRTAVAIANLNGRRFALVNMERPVGKWWYVTWFSFSAADASDHTLEQQVSAKERGRDGLLMSGVTLTLSFIQ